MPTLLVFRNTMNDSSPVGNTSQCPPEGLSVGARWVQTFVYLAIVLVALVGNVMVIMVVYRHRRMRSPTNYLIVNIALGDLMMVVFSMFPTAVSMLLNTHRWIGGLFGVITCKLFIFTLNASISCSIFSMTALALERFLAVVFSMKRFVYISTTKKLIAVVWTASILSNTPLLYATKVVKHQGVPYCTEDWSPAFEPIKAPAVFTVVSFVLQYALPLSIICPLYSTIILKVWYRTIPGNTTPANVRLVRRSKKNVLKMLVTTVLAFAVCWLLMHINVFLMYFSHVFDPCSIPWELQLSGFLLGHSNTAINCCIYVIFSDDYRRGFKEFFRPFVPHFTKSVIINQSEFATQEASVNVRSSARSSVRGSVGRKLHMVRLEDMGPEDACASAKANTAL